MRCTVPAGSAPQVVRVCEASSVLGAGVACVASDALATGELGAAVNIAFTCPAARSTVEPGGSYALYTGASFTSDANAVVTCTPN